MSTMGNTRSTARDTRRTKDAETVLGNSIASIAATAAVVLAVLGLLVGFDILDNDLPFQNGLVWLISGIIVATLANVFRREHHIAEDTSRHKSQDAEAVLGNSVATLMAIGAAVLATLGLLVAFDIINTDLPFENGLLWLASGVIVAMNANVFRREHRIVDPDEMDYDTRTTPRDTRRV
jgi:FtsH-binding integral membrane protein